MILRCAACMSSGSACAIAFSAASRSPLLIAASTVRTAPRIWVRRDLLTMVRRAILRVAFLAEVVLAILKYPSAATHPGAGLIDVCRPLRPTLICFRGVPEMLSPERQITLKGAPLKEQRR